MKDEFFRGRDWDDFESFKADLEAYIVHWNTRRKQKRLKGLIPEEFRNQSLMAAYPRVLISASKIWGAVQTGRAFAGNWQFAVSPYSPLTP